MQVIEAVQRNSSLGRSTPDWLLDLALSDKAAVVRYWAARAYPFHSKEEQLVGLDASDEAEELMRTQRVLADPEELVRACAEQLSAISFDGLEKLSRLSRLRFLREVRGFMDYQTFVTWLTVCVDKHLLDDGELALCVEEFFRSAGVIEREKDPPMDGPRAASRRKAIEDSWTLTKRSGKSLAVMLACYTPLESGTSNIDIEALIDALPADLQEHIVYRVGPEANAFRARVKASPQRFDPEIVSAVKHYSNLSSDVCGRSARPTS